MNEYVDGKKLQEIFEKSLAKAMEIKATSKTNNDVGSCTTYAGTTTTGTTYIGGYLNLSQEKDFIPTKIIYNCPATICYFSDGTREVVKVTEDEEYVKEYGVMACIMKKIFKSRNQFKKLVDSGYENTDAIYERNAHNAMLKRR